MTIPSEFPSTVGINEIAKLTEAVTAKYGTFTLAVNVEEPYNKYIIVPARNELEARTGSGVAGIGVTVLGALRNALEE